MEGTSAAELFDLSEDAIDTLPFGLIAVAADGTIEQYNAYESRLARLPKDNVIGRNFFRDVAPCTAVREFQGRFDRFVAEGGDGSESFDFIFRFAFGTQHVNVTFLRSARSSGVKILVNRYDERGSEPITEA